MYTNDKAIMAHSQIKSIYPNGVNGQYINVHIHNKRCSYLRTEMKNKLNEIV